MKYLEHVQEYIHPATQYDLLRIDRFQQKHHAEYNRWMERDTTCVEKVFVGFDCAPDKQKSMMASLRKLSPAKEVCHFSLVVMSMPVAMTIMSVLPLPIMSARCEDVNSCSVVSGISTTVTNLRNNSC